MEADFSIVTNQTAELIVKICFLTNDLKQNFGEDFIRNENKFLRCDYEILNQMDAVLGSNTLSGFRNKLDEFAKITNSFIEIYKTSEISFSEKDSVQNTLQKLAFSLIELKQKTT